MTYSWQLVSEPVDLIVPVPLHRSRWAQRGFNQAEVLARGLANRLSVAFADPLVRSKRTKPQFGLAKSDRRSNVRAAFNLKRGQQEAICGKIVLVVDDVVATGSTIEECARILRQKGAKQVWGLVIARA